MHGNDGPWNDRPGIGNEDVARVSVRRQRVRNESIVPRIAHRRIEEAVDDERSGFLVHFVFDRLAADRHLDDCVDLLRRISAYRNVIEIHRGLLASYLLALGRGSGRFHIVPGPRTCHTGIQKGKCIRVEVRHRAKSYWGEKLRKRAAALHAWEGCVTKIISRRKSAGERLLATSEANL